MDATRWLRLGLKRLAYGGIGGGPDGQRVVAWLDVRPGSRVADVGAGFGEFAARFAAAVGEQGAVYAVDVDADLRAEVRRLAARRGLAQLVPVAATPDDPGIPEPVDLVFLSSSFHHLPDRVRYFAGIRDLLRPGGRVAILEARPSRLSGWFGHATAPEEVRVTLETAGYRWQARSDLVRRESLQVFTLDDGGSVRRA